jgi:signal transduction histidine kinase
MKSDLHSFSFLFKRLQRSFVFHEGVLTKIDGNDLVVVDYYNSDTPERQVRASFPIEQFGIDAADLTKDGLESSCDECCPNLNTEKLSEIIDARLSRDSSANQTWLGAPLVSKQSIFGFLFLRQEVDNPYSCQEITTLRNLVGQDADRILIHLQRAKANQQAEMFQRLIQVHEVITSHLELDQTYQSIIQQATQITNTPDGHVGVAIHLVEKGQLFLVARNIIHDVAALVKPHNLYSFDETATGYAVSHHTSVRTYNVAEDPRPLFQEHYRTRRYKSFMSVPLMAGDTAFGALTLVSSDSYWFTPEDELQIMGLAPAVIIAIENANYHQQSLTITRLEERQRIAQDLHDTLAQTVFSIGMEAKIAAKQPLVPAPTLTALKTIQHMADHCNEELRSSIFVLNNLENINEQGLIPMLQKLIHEHQTQSGIQTQLINHCDDLPNIPPKINEATFRVVREALANIRKHAHASITLVIVNFDEPNILTIQVQDDGVGIKKQSFNSTKENFHYGISNMRQLSASVNGELSIQRNDDGGTTVRLKLPIPEGN